MFFHLKGVANSLHFLFFAPLFSLHPISIHTLSYTSAHIPTYIFFFFHISTVLLSKSRKEKHTMSQPSCSTVDLLRSNLGVICI